MLCLLCNRKGNIKEYRPNKNNNRNKNKESSTVESNITEAGGEEEIVDGEMLNWGNLNLNNFEEKYSNEY